MCMRANEKLGSNVSQRQQNGRQMDTCVIVIVFLHLELTPLLSLKWLKDNTAKKRNSEF